MINKHSFVKIIDGLRDYCDTLDKMQVLLDVCMEENFLTNIIDTVMVALTEDLDYEDDSDIYPLISHYAFDCNFGRNDEAKKGVLMYGHQKPFESADDLYDCLMFKNYMLDEYNDDFNDDYPCNDCSKAEFCDGWEARYCCTLCEYHGGGDCDNCDPMDI